MSRSVRDRASARPRLALTAAVLAVMTGAAIVVALLARQNLRRLELVDSRLQDTGRFAEARARLQRRAFELLPPTLTGESVLVSDVLLQIRQARQLGSMLPEDVRASLERLDRTLQAPFVLRDDLVLAASLLERIVDAESVLQEQIFANARADIRNERNVTLAGLVLLTALGLLGVWKVLEGGVPPFRPFVRLWLQGVLDQRRALLRAERLALAGEAAAGLAHEIRNPLAGVTLALQNLERDSPDVAPRIQPVVSELERVTRTLNEHLGALRTPPESLSDVDVSRLVLELVELLRYEADKGVQLVTAVPQGIVCRTRQDRLRQVLLNLALNALQALEASGGTVRFELTANGAELTLAVRDTGPGFPEAVLQGVPAPFTSTKPGGVGLGLRLVQRMVRELGGDLELSNPEEGGALAVLRLPCAEQS
ncbi:MAG: sensor histidine kinase [Gemmatimonadota bacterium]